MFILFWLFLKPRAPRHELCGILEVTRRSGGVVCRHLDDLDAVFESDTCDDLRQLIRAFETPPGL